MLEVVESYIWNTDIKMFVNHPCLEHSWPVQIMGFLHSEHRFSDVGGLHCLENRVCSKLQNLATGIVMFVDHIVWSMLKVVELLHLEYRYRDVCEPSLSGTQSMLELQNSYIWNTGIAMFVIHLCLEHRVCSKLQNFYIWNTGHRGPSGGFLSKAVVEPWQRSAYQYLTLVF